MSKACKWIATTLLLATIFTLVFTLQLGSVALAEGATGIGVEVDTDNDAYRFVEQLCAIRADKTKNATAIATEVREFLSDKFSEALGRENAVEQVPFPKTSPTGYNLVAKIGSSGDKQLIIGAHYDYDTAGQGASDNATGLAVMYLVMQQLAERDLPFNVVFVAFDQEEQGMLGSYAYVNSMTAAEKANTLAMFNLDTIGTGDNLYVMCENKSTDLADLILSKSTGILEKPYAVGTYGAVDFYGYGYYEFIQGSDHTPFRLQGIPVAQFFAGTFSATFWNFTESEKSDNNLMNTSRDTFSNLVKYRPDFYERIETVANAIADSVKDPEFVTVCDNTRSQLVNLNFWYNGLWTTIAVVGVVVLLAVFAWLYYRKLQKKSILGTADVKTQKVFDKPDASDIFTFEQTDKQDGTDVDDIFTFKK